MTTDIAVSTVIGTILTLGLVVAALATYQLSVVPQQIEEAEARQMKTVARGMSELTTDVREAAREPSAAGTASPVPLSREGSVLGAEEQNTGSLTFEPGGRFARVGAPTLDIVTRNGDPVLAGGATWRTVEDGDRIEGILTLLGFQLRADDPDPADGERVGVVAGDAEGSYAGDLFLTANVTDTDLSLSVETREPPSPGTSVYDDHVLSLPVDHWDGDHHVDAMADVYGFASLLEEAADPATLTFQDEGLEASYRIAYERQAARGVTTVVGDGRTLDDVNRTYRTGVLVYEAQNRYYPQQSLRVEHGGLVRSQAEGSAFAIEPPFRAAAGGGVVELGLEVPSLRGPPNTVSGTGIATVHTLGEDPQTYAATAGQINLTFGSGDPQLWAEFLDRELTEAGLTSTDCPPTSPDSACQFEVTTSSSSTRVVIHGPHATDTDPKDPVRDVHLDVERAAIETELQR